MAATAQWQWEKLDASQFTVKALLATVFKEMTPHLHSWGSEPQTAAWSLSTLPDTGLDVTAPMKDDAF